jgi:hypothetical protein
VTAPVDMTAVLAKLNRPGGEGLAHLVGDYVVQTDWMATQKTSRWSPALAHAVTYAACFLPVTRSWKALAVIGGTHAVIDRYRLAKHVAWAKNQLAPAEYRPPHTATGYRDEAGWLGFALLIITDNTMHLLINRWALRRWSR